MDFMRSHTLWMDASSFDDDIETCMGDSWDYKIPDGSHLKPRRVKICWACQVALLVPRCWPTMPSCHKDQYTWRRSRYPYAIGHYECRNRHWPSVRPSKVDSCAGPRLCAQSEGSEVVVHLDSAARSRFTRIRGEVWTHPPLAKLLNIYYSYYFNQ